MTEPTDAPTAEELERWCREIISDVETAASSRRGSDAEWRVERWASGTEEIARALLIRLERERRNRTPESIAMKKILKNQLKRRRLVP